MLQFAQQSYTASICSGEVGNVGQGGPDLPIYGTTKTCGFLTNATLRFAIVVHDITVAGKWLKSKKILERIQQHHHNL